jgi:hypothetical protein
MRRLTDAERATLLIAISEQGMPTWAQGLRQHVALAMVAGWSQARAQAALGRAEDAGYLDTPRKDRLRQAAARRRG